MSSSFRIDAASVSDRGLSEKRPQNEDSYLEMTQSGLFAVADGVGGAQAGEVASQMAMEILGEAFANLPENADAEDVMRLAIERANSAIHQMSRELPQLSSMATTIVALHIAGNIATIGHVGDSRLYRVDRDGELHRDTADHSMVAEEVRAGRMTEEQAENHPSRNIISRALGAEPTVEVDLKTILIEPGTSFLICSDGVTRHIGDQEIKGVLTFGGEPREVCDYIKDLCYERGAEDNLTAVIVKVRDAVPGTAPSPAPPAPPPPEVDHHDHEQVTIATARAPFESKAADESEEDELLELDTRELSLPTAAPPEPPPPPGASDVSLVDDAAAETIQIPAAEALPVVTPLVSAPPSGGGENFSMFGDSGEGGVSETAARSGGSGKFIVGTAMLLIGVLGGLAFYHFFSVPPPAASGPQLTEMKAENIAFTTFEKLRRKVDDDPAGYLKEMQSMPPPDDAEDYYLSGRAYLLTGDLPKAHIAFLEARNHLGQEDPTNRIILGNDIGIAIVITNDPTVLPALKKELEASKAPTNANANANTASNANR